MNLSELPHLKSITDDNAPQLGVVLPKSNLYHYTPSVLAVKNIISNGELWLSKSTFMNDRFEISYGLNLAKEVFDEYDNPVARKAYEYISKSISENYFILCFSGNPNSRFLWENYSNKNGYAIEFKPELIFDFVSSARVEKLIFEGGKYRTESGKRKISVKENQGLTDDIPAFSYEYRANYVFYDREEQKAIVKELIEYMIKHEKDTGLFVSAGALLASVLLFFKDPFFKDEEEYRLVIKLASGRTGSPVTAEKYLRRVINHREKNNCLIPYLTLKMYDSCEYVNGIGIGYGNREPYAKFALENFVSMYSNNIEISEIQAPLQMF